MSYLPSQNSVPFPVSPDQVNDTSTSSSFFLYPFFCGTFSEAVLPCCFSLQQLPSILLCITVSSVFPRYSVYGRQKTEQSGDSTYWSRHKLYWWLWFKNLFQARLSPDTLFREVQWAHIQVQCPQSLPSGYPECTSVPTPLPCSSWGPASPSCLDPPPPLLFSLPSSLLPSLLLLLFSFTLSLCPSLLPTLDPWLLSLLDARVKLELESSLRVNTLICIKEIRTWLKWKSDSRFLIHLNN